MARRRTFSRILPLLVVVLLGSATAASAYVVVLKNGNQLVVREKPQIRGGKAYLTLQNGTETFLPASDLDLAKTDELNKDNKDLGARVLDTSATDAAAAPPPRKPTISDLARQRSSLTPPEPARRKPAGQDANAAEPLPRTTAGNVDLMAVPRNDYRNSDVKTELLRYLRSQGNDQVSVFQGTEPSHVLVDITTNTEASVFKGLKDSATVLLQLQQLFPKKVDALEIAMATDARVRAGQFVLTPDQARELSSGGISPEAFFLRYVQF